MSGLNIESAPMAARRAEPPSELMTTSEAARYLKLSESYLHNSRLTGVGPRYVKAGRSVRYRLGDLEIWIEACSTASTSEAGARKAVDK